VTEGHRAGRDDFSVRADVDRGDRLRREEAALGNNFWNLRPGCERSDLNALHGRAGDGAAGEALSEAKSGQHVGRVRRQHSGEDGVLQQLAEGEFKFVHGMSDR